MDTTLEEDQGLAVATTLSAQAQRRAADGEALSGPTTLVTSRGSDFDDPSGDRLRDWIRFGIQAFH